jgi:hypothetical protein
MLKKIQALEEENTTDVTTWWGSVISQQNWCPLYVSFGDLSLRLLLDALKYVEALKLLSSFASIHNQNEVNYFALSKQSKPS